MSEFPALSKEQDQQFYTESIEDPSLPVELEGGYDATRPRFTRAPRTTYTTGYTDLEDADKKLLQAFYAQMRGGSDAWLWKRPTDDEMVLVRFKSELEFKLMLVEILPGGLKSSHWQVQFKVQEV